VPNVDESNVDFLGECMVDIVTTLLGEVGTHEVFQTWHREIVELEIQITKLKGKKKHFKNSQGLENVITMESTNYV
jgi:hypothetical protein